MDNNSLTMVEHDGLTELDYFCDFMQYLHAETAFQPEYFQPSEELEMSLKKLELHQLPLKIWEVILTSAQKLAFLVINNPTTKQFVSLFTELVIGLAHVLCDILTKRGLLFTLSKITSPVLSIISIVIFYVIKWAIIPLLQVAKPKIEKYVEFVTEQLKLVFTKISLLQIKNNK
ncbi:GSCOCG00007120001-RA-CDS [Cotesia congregata]|nr:GSCOCG00007120001-RA-CDS [Cotesia congregata]